MEKKINIIDAADYEGLLRAEFERDTILAALKQSAEDRYGRQFDFDKLSTVLSALGYLVDGWFAKKDAEE